MKRFVAICAFASSFFASTLVADTVRTIPFLANLSPANEVPPTSVNGNATALILLHEVLDDAGNLKSGSVEFRVTFRFPGATTVTGLHIHNGPAGSNGNIVIPTDINGSDKSVPVDASGRGVIVRQVAFGTGSGQPSLDIINDLVKNPQNYYANIHTTENPGGAMRGQLLRGESTVLMGIMSPANETPPIANSKASAVASVVVTRGVDPSGTTAVAVVTFDVTYTGFPDPTTFTGLHIHRGAAGVAGPVIINTGIAGGAASVAAGPGGAGNLHFDVPIAPSDANFNAEVATVDGLFTNPNNYYINLHTTVNPGGEIRSQLRNTDQFVVPFQVNMLPANETPNPLNVPGNAPAAVTVHTIRNADGSVQAGTVIFDVNPRGFAANTTFTGLHIHTGAAGVSGGVVIPTDLGTNNVTADTGNVNVFKIVTVADQAGIAALNSLVQNPANFYINIHSTTNPGGIARAQLSAPLGTPKISGIADASSTIQTAAPGSIIAIDGTSLAGFSSDVSGMFQVTQLPTSFNGATVKVGAVNAPVFYVGPGQINAEVPFETANGTVPVVVTTPAGTSSSVNLTVVNAAPSIFIVDNANSIGAIVKSTDFSVITPTNPVKAGDTIVIYSTGLGQTTPTVQTGVLVTPPSSTSFNNTVPVSVKIGTQNGTVVYSIASPGFTGLYQTAVTIPAGVSGTVSVVLSVGNTASNSVNITVQ